MFHSCPTPCHIQDPLLVQHSTNGAVDILLALKAVATGSVMFASKASKHTCLESEWWHGIDYRFG